MSKSRFLRQNHVFCAKIMFFAQKTRFLHKNHVFCAKITFFAQKSRSKGCPKASQSLFWASWRSPRPPPDPPKAAPRPPRTSSGLGLGQEANWGDSGGPTSQKSKELLSFFDDLELIPGLTGLSGLSGLTGSCPKTPVRDPPSTRARG